MGTTRRSCVGEHVRQLDGELFVSSTSGWRLEPGEEATVVSVKADGNFKLRNSAGQVSKYLYAKNFAYAKDECDFVEDKTVALHGCLIETRASRASRPSSSSPFEVCTTIDVSPAEGTSARRKEPGGGCSAF